MTGTSDDHHQPRPYDRARMLQVIADLASELCDARKHTEVIRKPARERGARATRAHLWETTQPGLLAQLAEAVTAGGVAPDGGGGRFVAGPKPPLCLEALSRYVVIEVAATKWCWTLRVDLRDTVESNIRSLVGAAGSTDADTMGRLVEQLRRWKTWAAVMTGWQSPAYNPTVPCPVCGQPGSLRINLGRQTALCLKDIDDEATACGARWDAETIGVLARYIAKATEKPEAPAEPVALLPHPAAARDLYEAPPCPTCGVELSVSWQFAGTLEEPDRWLPGVLYCGPCDAERAAKRRERGSAA